MEDDTTEAEEVVERTVEQTGNGSYVHVPNDWAERNVRVALLPRDASTEECDICGLERVETAEWTWLDEGGGAYFTICGNCQSQVAGQEENDVCPLCGTPDPEMSKSDGFIAHGSTRNVYHGCDECRSKVLFGNTEPITPVWRV